MEGDVNKMFKKKASAKIRNFVTRAKKLLKRPSHVTLEDWAVMKTNFDDDKYIKKCNKAQGHRQKYKIDGGASYCGGSINANEHRRRLTMELGRPPTVLELFTRTHKKKDGSWSGDMAAKVAKSFKELYKTQETVVNEKKSEEEMWVEAAGGPTNGRVLGLGYVGKKRMLDQGSSTSKHNLEGLRMKKSVADLQLKSDEKDEEIAKLKEVLEKQRDAIKVQDLQQQIETKEKGSLQMQIDVLRDLVEALHNSKILMSQNLPSSSQ
ncbi:uncharacterized protein LOC124930080 [Impatiens glandulifera]|uniref:uncharacterized protein LOC124930080 n=1 Tax=Impatiens glandulifera TaxID=253017 RepID=UPI001FB0C413|nr:uncharacterized protein LOC124930080 [Impatiens glandulifera]